MRRSLGLTLVLTGALTAFGCGGTAVTGLTVGTSGTVAITVGSGVTPNISWSAGPARRLTITQSSGGGVAWDLQATNPGVGFNAPAVFGVVPSGATENSRSAQLTQGTDYHVIITLVSGNEGSKDFRP